LQLKELLATQDVTMKLVAPTLDFGDMSKRGYPREIKSTVWDAVAVIKTGDTNTTAGVK
jgi:hypothetical protein